jgi:SAM-dependent methyltransferase
MSQLAWLDQTNFPRLWLYFQYFIGCLKDKQALHTDAISNNAKMLIEVGCSVGGVADVFKGRQDIAYTGFDIDKNAIMLAKARYQNLPNFRFECVDIRFANASTDVKADSIFLSSLIHHLDDNDALAIIRSSLRLLKPNGQLIMIEPLRPGRDDNWFKHTYLRLFEKGRFLRTQDEYLALCSSFSELMRDDVRVSQVRPNPFVPIAACDFVVAKFGLASKS